MREATQHIARITRFFPFFPFFTLAGLLTLALFLIQVSVGSEAGDTAFGRTLDDVLRVLIIPIYLMRMLVVMAGGVLFGFGGGSFPIWYDILTIPVLLLPYFLVDILFANWRRQIARHRRLRVPR
jgi:hypothetical protein